jgi:hypothetical protein
MKPNERESTANRFTIAELLNAYVHYKPRDSVAGQKNGMFAGGNGEKYIRLRINGVKVRLSHIVWRLNTGRKIPIGSNIHHKDEDKRNNNFINLELQQAVSHGNKNLRGQNGKEIL